jgi:hypothetical protein
MDLKTLEDDLSKNLSQTASTLIQDVKAEAKHVADPSQCGSIVQRHFGGIVIGGYVFMGLFLLAAIAAIALYTIK